MEARRKGTIFFLLKMMKRGTLSRPCKDIWIPESGEFLSGNRKSRKFLLVECGILVFKIQNPSFTDWKNPVSNTWNPKYTAWIPEHMYLHLSHTAPYLPPKILHKHCFQFLLGWLYEKTKVLHNFFVFFGGGGNKVHYGRCASGL